ncbi:MAG: hypothetical protein AB7Q97_20860 [Gammaproteobacteria bacterium]
MLREVIANHGRAAAGRRWFTDPVMDLYVWEGAGGTVERFQLCCRLGTVEQAIEWDCGAGYRVSSVDDGEPGGGTYKQTPLLAVGGSFAKRAVQALFAGASRELAPALTEFIAARLEAYEGN